MSYGFDHLDALGPGDSLSTLDSSAVNKASNVGLGNGLGGQLARSALVTAAVDVLEPCERFTFKTSRREEKAAIDNSTAPEASAEAMAEAPVEGALTESRYVPGFKDGPEPQGMFTGLLLNDAGQVEEKELVLVENHRWTFKGAVDFAQRGRGFCFFIRCLLELQRNVQVEEGCPLDPNLSRACMIFVNGHCGNGRMGEMYQLLTHFISNSVVFDEWARYLKDAFDNPRANTESFLVPHLEQVWGRFCRLLEVLEEVFNVLNSRYVWRHRLPKVGDLVREHMRRRCFSSDAVTRNELFAQEKCTNATVMDVKRAFGFNK